MATFPLSPTFSFSQLSLLDLLEARDLFHVHLINKSNVVATAIGRYLVRFDDIDRETKTILPEEKRKPPVERSSRTLFNSMIVPQSWPCILVFVDNWVDRADLLKEFSEDPTQIIPKSVYMPDGRIVPICVVEVTKNPANDDVIDESRLIYPVNFVGGGFPLKVFSQGVERIASVGCIVHDGHKYYALTNKHVVGDPGKIIYTELKGVLVAVGKAAEKQLDTIEFSRAYEKWPGTHIILNTDIGLIEIDNINYWKADIIGIGILGKVAELNVHNMSLNLIGTNVSAYGAVSGYLKGEIKCLFYRYKSVGGYEYIADYMIGPRIEEDFSVEKVFTRQGDSGTLWVIDEIKKSETEKEVNLPLALQWGQQRFINGKTTFTSNFSLATGLSNVARELKIDIVRDWNLDNDYSWGKLGHYKIGAYSCELVSDPSLKKLLMANQKNIGYNDDFFLNETLPTRLGEKFIPLADVADLYWRDKRKLDANNHFADMDEAYPDVHEGKSLLDLCKNEKNIDANVWWEFYQEMDTKHPIKKGNRLKPRLGALPFRVWQMYLQMIRSLKAGKLDEFICAGGTMSHYVGDASQPLHVSHLHHGEDESDEDVHTDYETNMLDQNKQELIEKVNAYNKPVKSSDLIGKTGKAAAKCLIELMRFTIDNLSPEEVLETWRKYSGAGKIKKMWRDLGEKTTENIAEGAKVMAILWQSAWTHGNGRNIPESKLKEISQSSLMALYKDLSFVESLPMSYEEFDDLLV